MATPESALPSPPMNSPTQPPHWKFWGTVGWGVAVAAVFLVLQAVTVLWWVVARNGDVESEELLAAAELDGNVLSIATLVTAVACCALIFGIVKLKKRSIVTDYLAIRPVSPRTMLQWLGFLAVFIVASDALTILLERPVVPEFMAEAYATTNPVWMIWLAFVIAAPLFEELFFRGFLFKGFAASFLGASGAILVTAGLWAVVHLQYDAYGMVTIFLLGLLLGAARAYTGSLLVPLALHAVGNLVATIEAAVMA